MTWEECAAAKVLLVCKASACSRSVEQESAVQVPLSPRIAGDMLQKEQAPAA